MVISMISFEFLSLNDGILNFATFEQSATFALGLSSISRTDQNELSYELFAWHLWVDEDTGSSLI